MIRNIFLFCSSFAYLTCKFWGFDCFKEIVILFTDRTCSEQSINVYMADNYQLKA